MSDEKLTMRIRKGQNEIEISGLKEEVIMTLRDLPSLVSIFNDAFNELGKEELNYILREYKNENRFFHFFKY